MQREYEGQSPSGGMTSSKSPYSPPSPPPPSPTRSLSPIMPSRPLSPSQGKSPTQAPNSPRPVSPPISPILSQFPNSNRSLSPPLVTPATAVTRSPSSHSRHTSLQSLSIMPPIREDANSIFSEVSLAGQSRSRNSFYQYGEDYITAYDRVGLTSSPGPRSASRNSARSVSSSRRSGSVRSAKSRDSGGAYALPSGAGRSPWARPSSDTTSGGSTTEHSGRETVMDGARDLERGPVSEPESEVEKIAMMETQPRISWWRRWRRFIFVLIVVLGLGGLAVGIIFGTRS